MITRDREEPTTTVESGARDAPPAPDPCGRPDRGRRADEAALVRRARAGDGAAFEAIVRRHERQIYSFIYRTMGDADDAADLLQECFVKAYRALPRARSDTNVSAWLHRIAANACLDVLRRRQRLRWLPWDGPRHDGLLLAAPADEPERAAVGRETRLLVRRTLDRMSRRHRLGLVLREYEGLSCAEIGEAMGLSRSAVKSMLFRARGEFRRTLVACEAERQSERPAPTTDRLGVGGGRR